MYVKKSILSKGHVSPLIKMIYSFVCILSRLFSKKVAQSKIFVGEPASAYCSIFTNFVGINGWSFDCKKSDNKSSLGSLTQGGPRGPLFLLLTSPKLL